VLLQSTVKLSMCKDSLE